MKTLRCPLPDCRQRFAWDVAKGFPRFCAMCGGDISIKDSNVISMPAFLTSHSKVPDKAVRAYMDGSEKRVEMAAELAGTTREEMSSIKVTDISDRQDVQAHIPVNNPVTQFMQQNPQAPIGFRPDGAQYSTQVQTAFDPKGRDASMGAKMITKTRGYHEKISRGSAVSDRPAEETLQPGYRRRG